MPLLISKSKYLAGRQCAKLLWHHYNARDLIPAPDAALQAVFDQGHEVGALAKQLFPGGIDIGDSVADLEGTIRRTAESLHLRRPLFEASFAFAGGYCRVDILNPVKGGAWEIVEVKSTTSLKDAHLDDLAFQAWVLTGTGLNIRKCVLCHINPDFVRHGEIDLKEYFTLEGVTCDVSSLSKGVEEHVEGMFKVIGSSRCPEVSIGPHCDNPYTCPLHDHCWDFLPKSSVMELYRGSQKGFQLLARGVETLRETPEDIKLTASQTIQKSVALSGKPHIRPKEIRQFLAGLEYPLHYLDFETFGTAIPMFDGTRPYQQIPFQFSCHVVGTAGAKPEHHQFLAEGKGDPRPAFMLALREAIGPQGSIVVYNASFEKSRLSECVEAMPSFAKWLASIDNRFVDLLVPFRNFDYYHPDQAGSASMKAVLPALTGRGYEGLDIQEGESASREFLRVMFGDVSEKERQAVRRQLEEYCGQDTEGMIWIVDRLEGLTAPA